VDGELPAGWIGVGGRDELTTYATRAPSELPPLPDLRLDGSFDWLTPPGRQLDWAIAGSPGGPAFDVRSVDRLERLAAERHVSPPRPLLGFLRSDKRHWVRSYTGCWLELPDRLVTFPGTNAVAIRFLNDQQGVVFWYLAVSPGGDDLGVVASADLLDAPEPSLDEEAAAPMKVAPSFEAFLLRYWLENEIAFRTQDGEPLSEIQREYAARWRPHR
jgi:hypothetical protein